MSTRSVLAALLLTGVAVVATGCGGGQTVSVVPAGTVPPTTPPTTTVSTAPPAPATTASPATGGPQPEALGASATVSNGADVAYTFSVDAVQADPSCTAAAGATATAGDHLLLVRATLTTTSAFIPGSLDLFNAAGSLRVVAPDGTVTTAVRTLVADACTTEVGRVPDPVRPSESTSFGFVVESPVTAGTLVYAPAGGTGWAWPLPG